MVGILRTIGIALAFVGHSLIFAENSNHRLEGAQRTNMLQNMQFRQAGAAFTSLKVLDKETGASLDSQFAHLAQIQYDGDEIRPYFSGWVRLGSAKLMIQLNGYKDFEIDNLRFQADSATMIEVLLAPASNDISSDGGFYVASFEELLGRDHGRVFGEIFDDDLHEPVSGAQILVQNLGELYRTDDSGRFSFDFGIKADKVRLHIWHAAYDSIVVEFSKQHLFTDKHVEVHFEARAQRQHSKNEALLIMTKEDWSSWTVEPYEFTTYAYHYLVTDGTSFGPAAAWECSAKKCFRLIHLFSDNKAWVHFKEDFGLMGRGYDDPTNLIVVSDSASHLATKSIDGGVLFSMMLMKRGEVVDGPKSDQ